MNVKEWAEKLNGREYRKEITAQEERQAKEEGIVIVYGASDDLMEFGGAIHDEVGAYDGGVACVTANGLVEDEDRDTVCSLCEHMKKTISTASAIKAVWEPEGIGASWLIEAAVDLPHEHFDIMEDGELYCRGLVFRLADASTADAVAHESEMAWERAMMAAIGEDGINSVSDAIAKLKAERDELQRERDNLAALLSSMADFIAPMADDNNPWVAVSTRQRVRDLLIATAKARGR